MRFFGGVALAGSCVVLAACHPGGEGQMTVIGQTDTARLARTSGIIRRSTPAHPGVLRVLFYGQSITSTNWTDLAADHLARTYPNTRFIVRNMAIGGNDAVLLERATERDVTDFYPDLVVFHVYGDSRAYERIIRLIRSRTAAEVIVQTDHVRFPVEPICEAGLHLGFDAPPPGCVGRFWRKQRVWDDFMSGTFIPRIAATYALAVDPRRAGWNAYLRSHDLMPSDLLQDGLHPNDTGWRLAAVLFDRYFDGVVRAWRGEPQRLVRSYPPPTKTSQGYSFVGNRVELIATAPLNGRVTATIDGASPQSIDGCWQTSRTSPVPTVPAWPALRQVVIDPSDHHSDEWTATLSGFDEKQDDFTFSLVSKRHGSEGSGRGSKRFVSPSGRVSIEPQDWAFSYAVATDHPRVPDGTQIHWKRQFVCKDQPLYALGNRRDEVRYVVATGLQNSAHEMTVAMDPGSAALVREVRVYRPPLTQ